MPVNTPMQGNTQQEKAWRRILCGRGANCHFHLGPRTFSSKCLINSLLRAASGHGIGVAVILHLGECETEVTGVQEHEFRSIMYHTFCSRPVLSDLLFLFPDILLVSLYSLHYRLSVCWLNLDTMFCWFFFSFICVFLSFTSKRLNVNGSSYCSNLNKISIIRYVSLPKCWNHWENDH